MSRSYVSLELRRLVADRADCLCEYCLIPHTNGVSFQVDHIISVKHSGSTTADNLSYACIYCNLQKGSDLGSINWQTGELVRFFNPRRDFWGEHFRLDEAVIEPLGDIGEVTVRIFDFNNSDGFSSRRSANANAKGERILERQALMEVNRYPSEAALRRIIKQTEE